MITIGQLADYAGVTTKTIRHYHERGLLAEPERDSSGYRRYTAQDAIDLVKIRTLATAGVPLARVKDLLDADPETLAAALAEIDRELRERIGELRRTRGQLAQIQRGERLFVSADVADYLDRLRELGISERHIRLERDGWILLQTASPEDAAEWIAEKLTLIADPEFRAICLDHDAAYDWSPDDPRLRTLADRVRDWHAGRPPPSAPRHPALAQFVARSQAGVSSPAWDQLVELLRT
ncbi:MerR family transcriptional regulator [Nocardia sp. XZ_19_385]|uniref:MerR family transcriptional regulator n=1 Tax=Nocardia sp. XZ_19_385 TaxID=2769488 RepID=UPI00188FFC81|nr:MerR family transcriptional regulator [Nocardia sp. XZ_19_385]